jgi:hypothetical protein
MNSSRLMNPLPEDADTVLAGPPKAGDLTSLVSRSPVVPIAPQREDEERPCSTFASKVTERTFLHGAAAVLREQSAPTPVLSSPNDLASLGIDTQDPTRSKWTDVQSTLLVECHVPAGSASRPIAEHPGKSLPDRPLSVFGCVIANKRLSKGQQQSCRLTKYAEGHMFLHRV